LQALPLEIAPKRIGEGREALREVLTSVDPILVGRIDDREPRVRTADVADQDGVSRVQAEPR
jgi:hypothetical protein